jgi:glycosyltransferase involved in cell wall biosynthesis
LITVDLINGRRTDQIFGTSKYTREILKRLDGITINYIEYPQVGKNRIVDGAIKRGIYPFIVKKNARKNAIKHVTNQDLAFLLNYFDLHPSIVTCYDLIPVSYYHNNSLYWQMNLKGMKKADHLITISEFSKREIIRITGYPGDKISVIYPGVDTNLFYPRHDRSILKRYGISPDDYVLLYVGSEEPRKNLALLLEAIAILKKDIPGIKLLKVGSSQMGGNRKPLLDLIGHLKLEKDVVFAGTVPEEELPLFYNAADLFVFPSLYEGFGLPPLEAMACGCPVIAADTSSLREVLGEGGIVVDPVDTKKMVNAIIDIIKDDNVKADMIRKGYKQASGFSWHESAQKMFNIYSIMEI